MSEEFEKRIVDLLSRFASGEAVNTDAFTEEENSTAEWLLDNGFLSGRKYKLHSNECLFSSLRISQKGLEHLKQVVETLVAQNNKERVYSDKHPIRARIVEVVAGGLLLAAALTFIKWGAGYGLPWEW